MQLFVMRHGPAEANSSSGRDRDRALTADGRARVLAVAGNLADRGENPSRILSSPLARAWDTAQIVASVLRGRPEVEMRAELAPDGDGFDLITELLAASTPSALIVGHEPNVSALTARLLPSFRGGFETAMIVAVDLGSGGAVQRFVIASG